jgi:hypothetical protein
LRSAISSACSSAAVVHPGDPEDGHDGVAYELLHRAVVALDDGTHLVEVTDHDAPDRLGIEPLPKPRRAGDIGDTTVTVLRTSREAAP